MRDQSLLSVAFKVCLSDMSFNLVLSDHHASFLRHLSDTHMLNVRMGRRRRRGERSMKEGNEGKSGHGLLYGTHGEL